MLPNTFKMTYGGGLYTIHTSLDRYLDVSSDRTGWYAVKVLRTIKTSYHHISVVAPNGPDPSTQPRNEIIMTTTEWLRNVWNPEFLENKPIFVFFSAEDRRVTKIITLENPMIWG